MLDEEFRRKEPWMLQASCRGVNPDLFYPERGESTKEAKGVCAGCPVRLECLEYAIAHNERFGIWGGKSERERRAIRKQRIQEGKLQAQQEDVEEDDLYN